MTQGDNLRSVSTDVFGISVGGMTCDITAITENEVYYLCVKQVGCITCKQELFQYNMLYYNHVRVSTVLF